MFYKIIKAYKIMTIGAGRTAMLRYGVAASVEHVKVLSGLVCRHVVDIGANCVGNRGQDLLRGFWCVKWRHGKAITN